jgi:hypothetical protein
LEEAHESQNNFEKPRLYPNPLKKRFSVEFPSKYEGNFVMQIVDMVGKKYEIGTVSLKPGGSVMQVDISKFNLQPGVYFFKIHSQDGKTDISKLMVQ